MLLNTAVKTIKRLSHKGDQDITTDQMTIDIVACVMDARRDIIARLPKKWLAVKATVPISTVAGTRPATYSLAADVQDPIVFWYTVGTAIYRLHRVISDQEWFTQIYNLATANNKPYHFREIGLDTNGYKQIELFPIPDTVYTINYEYYKTVATDMTVADLTTEIPDIPTQNQDALWKGGLYYWYKQFDDPAQEVAKLDYEAALLKVDKSDQEDSDVMLSWRWGIESQEPRGQNGMRIF